MTRLSLSSVPVEPSATVGECDRLRPGDPSVQVETLTISTIRVAERTCAGCNSCIAPVRWISEGQRISDQAFHDNRCLE